MTQHNAANDGIDLENDGMSALSSEEFAGILRDGGVEAESHGGDIITVPRSPLAFEVIARETDGSVWYLFASDSEELTLNNGAWRESEPASEEESEEEPTIMTDGGRDTEVVARCGAITSRDGSPCDRPVPWFGSRCHLHPRIGVPTFRDWSNVSDGNGAVGGATDAEVRAAVRAAERDDGPTVMTDGGSDRPDHLRDCPGCGELNNVRVNAEKCYSCGYRWGTDGEVIDSADRDGGAEILTDGGEEGEE